MIVDRSRLPEPGAPAPFVFPLIQKSTLANGLRVWSTRKPSVPVVSIMLLIRRGSADDPARHPGVAAITLDMLDEGSGSRSSIEMHEALAALGTSLGTDVGSDAALLSLTVLSRFIEPAMRIVADMVVRPALREADFERVRDHRLHRLMQLRNMPGAVADRTFVRLLYGEHPYGHTPLGDEQSLRTLSIDDVRQFYALAIQPAGTTLVVTGDCDHVRVAQLAQDVLGAWESRTDPVHAADTPLPTPSKMVVVPRPGAPQSELRIGHVAVARSTPDYHALVAANMVLGGQFVSRINLNLREEKGFTYGASTAFDFRRLRGPFSLSVSVQTSATAEAIHESLGEIAGIRGPRAVTKDELALAIAALTRGYARNFETAEHLARALAQIALHELPDDYFTQFVPRMLEVGVDDVTRVAALHLDPERLTTLIVGDLDVVTPGLRQQGFDTPVVLPMHGL